MRLSELWDAIIKGNASMSEIEFLQTELQGFLTSQKRQLMITSREYYKGNHDILKKVRTAISDDGTLIELTHLPNNKIVDNKFDDLVDSKVNYLLSKPIEVRSDVKLDDVFNRQFMKKLKNVGKDALIGGIGYLIPYINDTGVMEFKRVKPEQILPFWADEEHTKIDAFLYFYEIENYIGAIKSNIFCVEYFTPNGVKFYTYDGMRLSIDTSKEDESYLIINGTKYNYDRVPLITFKANDEELPLLVKVKTLQDALNQLVSTFVDSMAEDVRNTILVIKNYDGTDLGTFRQNLAMYGAVKVRTVDGVEGGVETLTIEVNAENYKTIVKLLKDAIIENGRGYDNRDDRMGNSPNQMNIISMYSDIDLDANEMELEFQASLHELLYFVKIYKNINNLDIGDTVDFIFNRDLPINEGEIIENCAKSEGIISKETIISNHPWVKNTADEIKRLDQEEEQAYNKNMGDYPIGGGNHEQVLG